MKQIKKHNHPLQWTLTLMLVTSIMWACNGGTKTEGNNSDTSTKMMAPRNAPANAAAADSLPPVDTSASGRPEGAHTTQ
jgi:hypothetical protein